jgi:hypothetical protein
VFLLQFWRCWRSYFYLSLQTHGSDSSCLQNNSKSTKYPRGDGRKYSLYSNNQRHPLRS